MDFSNIGSGTIVVIDGGGLNPVQLECLEVDAELLPTATTTGKPFVSGSTCWVADTQRVKTLHQGAWV